MMQGEELPDYKRLKSRVLLIALLEQNLHHPFLKPFFQSHHSYVTKQYRLQPECPLVGFRPESSDSRLGRCLESRPWLWLWLRHTDNWSPRPRSGSRTGAGARPRSESQAPAPGSESQPLASGAGLWLQVGLASSPIGLLKSCLLPQSELRTEYKFKRLSHVLKSCLSPSPVMFVL